jgi:hypothetical protein
MAWKEVQVGDKLWTVSPVVERVAHTHSWRLVLNCKFRGESVRTVWAETSLHSSSRSDLYAQADRLSEARLTAVVAQHVSD